MEVDIAELIFSSYAPSNVPEIVISHKTNAPLDKEEERNSANVMLHCFQVKLIYRRLPTGIDANTAQKHEYSVYFKAQKDE